MLTVEQLATIRTSWIVWDPPTDVELQARADVLGSDSIYPVVIEQIRRAIAVLSSPTTPVQLSIVGDVSLNTGKNIDSLRQMLTDAQKAYEDEQIAAAGGSGIGSAQLVRKDPVRGGWYGAPVASSGW